MKSTRPNTLVKKNVETARALGYSEDEPKLDAASLPKEATWKKDNVRLEPFSV
jgi:hypothetical protein